MKGVKKPVKYKSLSLPEPLFKEMKVYVQKNSKYRNMAEFLRVSIREKMDKEKYWSDIEDLIENSGKLTNEEIEKIIDKNEKLKILTEKEKKQIVEKMMDFQKKIVGSKLRAEHQIRTLKDILPQISSVKMLVSYAQLEKLLPLEKLQPLFLILPL